MSVDAIRAQLKRLKVHAVNLDVTAGIASFVELQGSLLQYWKLPRSLDGSWLLIQLQAISDAAGPEAMMNALLAAHQASLPPAVLGPAKSQQQLF
jgi:hypothetical protein